MKKRGFTLAETLIVLAVVGIVTAIIAPHMVNMKPNQNKIMYLRTYDALSETIKELANNSKLFPVCEEQNGNTYCYKDYPLYNTSPIISNSQNLRPETYQGIQKLCLLLAYEFNGTDVNCSNANIYRAFDINNPVYSFITPDNIGIYVNTKRGMGFQEDSNGQQISSYITNIGVNVNRNASNSCMKQTNNNCNDPNLFEFIIDGRGRIEPSFRDVGGDFYIKNRTSSSNQTITDQRTQEEKLYRQVASTLKQLAIIATKE